MNHAQYDQKKIDALASELMEPQRLADGGPPDVPPRSRIAKAAAAVRAAGSPTDDVAAIDSASGTVNLPAQITEPVETGNESFRLYHGTPHVFGASQRVRNRVTGKEYVSDPKMVESVMAMMPDQYEVIGENPLGMFDINRIGSGEGAQAYGFGAYGTQVPDVGRGYRQTLLRRHDIPDTPQIGGQAIQDVYSQIERRAARLPIEQARKEYDKLAIIEQMIIDGDILGVKQGRADYDPEAYNWFEQSIAPKYTRPGALYEMQVNAPQSMFLDWDKPIADQTPEVQASLQAAGIYDPSLEQRIALLQNERQMISLDRDPVTNVMRDERRWHDLSNEIDQLRKRQPANMTGRQAYYLSAADATSQAEASEALKGAGIPGIQYLDQASRGDGDGTRNFVIFDPKMIEILEKYGLAGATTGAAAIGAGALSSEDDAEGMSKGGLVDKLRSAASSVKEAGNVYKAAVGNMFSPFEPVEPQLGDPNDYEFPELRLRRPGIVNLAVGMPNMAADLRDLFGAVKDVATGDEVPDESWRRFDIASEAQGRYEEDMDKFLRSYTGKSMDELSGPMSAVLGVSEALAQPGIISAKAVAGLPRLARYLSNITEFATPVTVASPGAMLTGATVNAGIRALPALREGDELKQIYNSYLDQDLPNKTGRDLTGREQAGLNKYLQELLGKKDGGLIDRINQSFYENISKPAVGTAIDMTLGLGDLAQMAARYLGNKAGFDAGEFTSVAQPVKEAIGVDDYNPYTIGGVGASILPFAAAGRTAQAINAAPAGVGQIQAALPNLGRESAAYVGAEAAGAGAREFMPESTAAQVLAGVAGGMGGSALGSQPTSMGIIKERGGNWLDQSINNRLEQLHSANQGMREDTPARQLAELEEKFTPEGMALLAPQTREFVQQNIDQLRSRAQIDNWIDSKLTRYIRNEMATESDPIRLQADAFEGVQAERLAQKDAQIARATENMERARLERGRTPEEMTASREQIRELQRERALIAAQTGLHVNPDFVGVNRYQAPNKRRELGYPMYGSGRSYAGKAWEDSADVAINRTTPETLLSGDVLSRNNFLEDYPWMQNIPSDANIYGLDMRRGGMDALGFDHMMDELRNATRPDSDLPDSLRIDPNYLSKMSVPQIAQRVDEINAYRATLEAEANERLANNAATRMFREYPAVPGTETPNQQELRWVELALPDAVLPEGYRTVNSPDGLVRLIDKDGRELSAGATPEEAASLYNREERIKSLSDALKYEGDTLNHCVGGYCDKVVGGQSRIYSLRDALGQPYATIETGNKPIVYSDIVRFAGIDAASEMAEKGMSVRQMVESIPEFPKPKNILQIKGKRNAAPAEEYLPFVQDFVRSQDWNDVRDLENSGLYKADPYELGMYLPQDERLRNIAGRRTEDFIRAQKAGLFNNQKYLTRREWEDILLRQIESESGPLPDVEGFKKGGLVYDADAINALAAQLMEPVRLAEGGPPPRSRIARAAAAVRSLTDDTGRAANNALDMSAEARMQRAAEQGFNVNEVLYHGTDKSFENFIPKRGLSGKASYLTPDADVASAYAMGDVKYKKRGEGANLLPAYVRGNILDQQDLTRGQEIDIWKAIEDYELAKAKPGTLKYEMLTDKKFPSMSESLLDMTDEEYVPDFVQMMEKLAEIKRTEDILGGLGYTGVRGLEELIDARNRPGLREYESIAVFDPKNIRSVNARFNPLDIDSSNILSGIGAGAVGLGVLASQEQPEEFSNGGRIRKATAAIRGATTPPRAIPDELSVSDEDMMRIARDLGIDVDETDILTDMPSITQYTAADRAAAGRRAASLIRSQDQMKASEALGRLMEQGFTKTSTTQADRTRVGGGNIGGPAFPVLGEVDPEYAGRSWGVMNQGTASRLMNLSSPETAWTTMLGSSDQLKSNPIVFDKLMRAFLSSMRKGNLSPELESKINQNLRLTFGEDANIRDPNIWDEADTFAKRAALADLMMGQGIAPAKGGVALGGEKSGRGVIFKPSEILMAETERGLMHPEYGGNVPTFALGPRLFTIGETAEYRPDLHPGFPTLLEGRDLGYNVMPTPTEVYLPDWHRRYKSLFPERKPGYYEMTSGLPSEGLPSQNLTDDYIRHLIREGFSQGGLANYRDMIRSN